jgi:hypothetical protein
VLDKVDKALAHHSFHVFAVYPWVRFLDVDPSTPLRILQACRIRWGVVDSVAEEQVVMTSRPLQLADGALALGEPTAESVRCDRDGIAGTDPRPGDIVAAHWHWVCGTLDADDAAELERPPLRRSARSTARERGTGCSVEMPESRPELGPVSARLPA